MTNKFKNGTKVKIVPTNGYGATASGCPVGRGTITGRSGGYIQLRHDNGTAYNAFENELRAQALSRKELEAEIEEKKGELSDLETRLEWLNEFKTEEFDEDQYRVYRALAVLETKKTKVEKAKVIAELLK